jgi:hypothetical protein
MTWSGSVSVDVATSLGTVIESLKLVNVPSDTVFFAWEWCFDSVFDGILE